MSEKLTENHNGISDKSSEYDVLTELGSFVPAEHDKNETLPENELLAETRDIAINSIKTFCDKINVDSSQFDAVYSFPIKLVEDDKTAYYSAGVAEINISQDKFDELSADIYSDPERANFYKRLFATYVVHEMTHAMRTIAKPVNKITEEDLQQVMTTDLNLGKSCLVAQVYQGPETLDDLPNLDQKHREEIIKKIYQQIELEEEFTEILEDIIMMSTSKNFSDKNVSEAANLVIDCNKENWLVDGAEGATKLKEAGENIAVGGESLVRDFFAAKVPCEQLIEKYCNK